MSAPLKVDVRMSDEELVEALKQGSDEAFSLLVGRYKNPLVNFTYRMTGDYETAVDLVQETFLRLYTRAGTYRPVARFSTWVYAIASNLARSELRRRKRWRMFRYSGEGDDRSDTRPEPSDPGALPDEQAEEAMRAEEVGAALRALPAVFREALILYYIQEMKYEEICDVLGIRMGTLKSRLNRGRNLLAESLKGGRGVE